MANEMRDRLVELLNETFDKQYTKSMLITAEHTADHLLEDGWIRLPCKVGETLHLIQRDWEDNYFLTVCEVSSKITMLSILRAYEEKTVVYMSTDKDQAEQKLKEMRGENADTT